MISLICSNFLYGDLNGEMNKFFHKFGSSSNSDPAEVYNGQRAGYFTGGGATVRNRVMNSKLVNINLPRFDAGCGGIDLYAGGFSFINKDELVRNLKSIGSNAVGYAFLLGLQTLSPQVATTIEELQTWSNSINSMNINSCETAAQLVSAAWPKKTEARQQICRTIGGKEGLFADYADARHGCSGKGAQESTDEKLKTDPKYKGILSGEYNVAWEAIKRQKDIKENSSLSHLFMNLTGTIIKRNDGDNSKIHHIPSKALDESFLKALFEGNQSTRKIEVCINNEDNKCLFTKEVELRMAAENSFFHKVKERLTTIQDKAINDEPIEEEDRDFIGGSRIPIYKCINVITAYEKNHSPISLNELANILSMDMMLKYLQEVVEMVEMGAKSLQSEQYDDEPIKDFLLNLENVERKIQYYETINMKRFDQEMKLVKKMELLEEKLFSEINLN